LNNQKNRILGLAAIEKSKARQRSRLTWLKKGDTNTKYFHLMANIRKQKNTILALQVGDTLATNQKQKHEVIYEHFLNHIGSYVPRSHLLNLTELEWHPKDLHHLDLPFSEDEVKAVLATAPKVKALGPDDFIGLFSAHAEIS
jgi:hypothetical protein